MLGINSNSNLIATDALQKKGSTGLKIGELPPSDPSDHPLGAWQGNVPYNQYTLWYLNLNNHLGPGPKKKYTGDVGAPKHMYMDKLSQ